jgi:hypothetical protein
MKELELVLKLVSEAPKEIEKVCEQHKLALKVLAPTKDGQDALAKIFAEIFVVGVGKGLDIAKELAE